MADYPTSVLTSKAYAAIEAARNAADNAAASCKATQDAIANLQLPQPPAAPAPLPTLSNTFADLVSHDVMLAGGYIVLAVVFVMIIAHFARKPATPAAPAA